LLTAQYPMVFLSAIRAISLRVFAPITCGSEPCKTTIAIGMQRDGVQHQRATIIIFAETQVPASALSSQNSALAGKDTVGQG
jgi:hypothetical protein